MSIPRMDFGCSDRLCAPMEMKVTWGYCNGCE